MILKVINLCLNHKLVFFRSFDGRLVCKNINKESFHHTIQTKSQSVLCKLEEILIQYEDDVLLYVCMYVFFMF